MDTSPSQLSHFEALRILNNKNMRKDFEPLFEMSIIHWLYASRLKELPHINISGYLNEVDHHKKLINKTNKKDFFVDYIFLYNKFTSDFYRKYIKGEYLNIGSFENNFEKIKSSFRNWNEFYWYIDV